MGKRTSDKTAWMLTCVCVCEWIDQPVDHLSPWMTAISREAILISVIISGEYLGRREHRPKLTER